jgi:hypothetical protein
MNLTLLACLSILKLMPKFNSLSQKWKLSIIILVILAILVLWYLSTAKLMPNFLKPIGDKNITSTTKIKSYEIAWQGNKNDKSGRTVLAKGQRSEELLEDKFYWSVVTNKELKLIGYSHGIGVFKKWEGISGSKDRYLTLSNPDAKTEKTKELHIRVIFEPKITNSRALTYNTTQLSVENLDYGFTTKSVASSVPIDYFNKLVQKQIDILFKPGDIIAVYPVFLDIETAKKEKSLMQKDENGYPIAQTVLIRRFGGRDTLQTNF